MLRQIMAAENLNHAYERIRNNQGAAGIDGMTVDQLLPWLIVNGGKIWRSILDGTYQPSPARNAEIPKGDGTTRKLAIPTVVDRLIQRAIAQVLGTLYEPKFSTASYAFRPGRNALLAVLKCQEYLNAGYIWTVDMDLEKFFDTVNQKELMKLLSRDIKDRRVLDLIEKYLHAGVIQRGRFEPTETGVGTGSALSPLLANVMLNELDQELTRRGYLFLRYSDDIAIFCKTQDEARAALDDITPFIEGKLLLKVNREKTRVDHAGDMRFLGYGFREVSRVFQPRVHQLSFKKMKEKIQELVTEAEDDDHTKLWQYITGWVNYYRLADIKRLLAENRDWMGEAVQMMFLRAWSSRKGIPFLKSTSTFQKIWMRVTAPLRPKSNPDLPFKPSMSFKSMRRIILPAAALLTVAFFADIHMKYLFTGMCVNALFAWLKTSF